MASLERQADPLEKRLKLRVSVERVELRVRECPRHAIGALAVPLLEPLERRLDVPEAGMHRGDFVRACLDLWERRAPFGIYNITNPGYISTREVVQEIQRVLSPEREFAFFSGDAEFYGSGTRAIRSNCILEVDKLLGAGVRMRPVSEALADALKRWQATPELCVA